MKVQQKTAKRTKVVATSENQVDATQPDGAHAPEPFMVTMLNDIDSDVDRAMARLNLLEHAVEGRFDNDFDRETFKLPIGDVLTHLNEIVETVKAIRAKAVA